MLLPEASEGTSQLENGAGQSRETPAKAQGQGKEGPGEGKETRKTPNSLRGRRKLGIRKIKP